MYLIPQVLASKMVIHPEVADALATKKPVVALESCVWAQGLPRPLNLAAAQETCDAVRQGGAVPAVICVLDGKIHIGISDEELELLCTRKDVAKTGDGDLPGVLAAGGCGATTVSASLRLAQLAGISVFATGGLGGVHIHWNSHLDISADLGQLANTNCLVVCSGVKAVLDIPATIEVFESLSIPLAMYRTDTFPRFYTTGIKAGIGFRLDTPQQVKEAYNVSLALLSRGLVVANPVPKDKEVPSMLVDSLVEKGIIMAESDGYSGKRLTPYLLDFLVRETRGATLEANRALMTANATLAAEFAVELLK